VIVSVGVGERGSHKDTARNIISSGEFVVNMVTEDLLAAMNVSAADFPSDESELSAAGLHPAESLRVKVPRVAEAQASLECTLHSRQALGHNTLIVGQVGPRLHIEGFAPIGRLGAPSMYCRTTDRFDLPRMTYAKWREEKGGRDAD